MSNALRRNRKGADIDILRLNAIGLSLATIAAIFKCHPSSITLRLKNLNIPVADTRRTFMEDIYNTLPPEFKNDLADVLMNTDDNPGCIKNYVRKLLVADVAVKIASIQPARQDDFQAISQDVSQDVSQDNFQAASQAVSRNEDAGVPVYGT